MHVFIPEAFLIKFPLNIFSKTFHTPKINAGKICNGNQYIFLVSPSESIKNVSFHYF